MKTTIAPSFLEEAIRVGREVLADHEKRIPVQGFPEFVVFFSAEEPPRYYFDLCEYFKNSEGGVYIAYEPPPGDNHMLIYATY